MMQEISLKHNQNEEDIIISYFDIIHHDIDVVYCSRIQKERSYNENEIKVDFIIDNVMVEQLKESAIILHPLPRNEELHVDVDKNKRNHYFKQMEYSIPLRMALMDLLLEGTF
jgi:aspartate carbamoyltransferase catalytic subunit